MASKESISHTTVMKRDQRQSMVAYVRQECLKHHNPKCLNDMLDVHLDPTKTIDDYDSIQCLKWLMAGGPQFDVFAKKVREYDSSVMCGLVWTTNFVAYRCRTCAISPCMSLCADCFMAGSHEGHDYNMFRSQAGGACDCGDANVMNPRGFCPRHGPDNQQSAAIPPAELLSVAQAMMPRIFMRLLFYLRDTSDPGSASYSMNLSEAEQYIAFLQSLSDMGAAMRRIITLALVDRAHYQALQKGEGAYYEKSIQNLRGAFTSLERTSPASSFYMAAGFKDSEEYRTMLEELVFWLCKCEFPQSLVTLLLGLLPDDIYKNEFTVAFVRHYSKIVRVLTLASERSTVANRVVHISVQLFSNEILASRMVKEHNVLKSVVQSLQFMLISTMVPSSNLGGPFNRHQVVECEKATMKEHCYWPVVSDLINLLSHKAVSHSFLQQQSLRTLWMDLLTSLQGMNLNVRELTHHVEYEPDTYYAAFSAELEISSSPMWSLINHCTTPGSKQYVKDMIKATLEALDKWFSAIDFKPGSKPHDNQLTFHLPLHRYLAGFLMLGVSAHNIPLDAVLPPLDLLCQIMMHPLQIQVCMPQIYGGMWVRNGIQIKGQAMTYIQCHFCYSMSDLDIYLMQVCAASMQPDQFVELVLDRFRIMKWLLFEHDHKAADVDSGGTPPDLIMLDGCLSFFIMLIGLRTYVGIGEKELVQKEMATLLCMSDRQHSQLSDLMPERSGMSATSKELFEPTLSKLADYKAPSFEAGSGLNSGCYTPKGSVWIEDFDPVMVAQRAIYKKDFQAAMDRFTAHVRSTGAYKGKNTPWPPYKLPEKVHLAYSKMYGILNCPTMHAFIYTILFKILHEVPTMPDSVLYKTVHLIDLCLHFAPKTFPSLTPSVSRLVKDGDLRNWFRTTDIKANICEVINRVELCPKEDTARDIDHMDLSNSSLEEMFSIQPSILATPSGPITAAQTGQFPSVSMPSGSVTTFSTIASSSHQPVTATPEILKPRYHSCGVTTSQPHSGSCVKELGESIISLLIKLHDKLSFPPTIYKPGSTTATKVEIGDGSFHIARFLDRLIASSSIAARYVQSTCKILHSRETNDKAEDPEDSDIKRKKAFDRQQRLMAKFASKQMAFMAQATHGDDDHPDEAMMEIQETEGAMAGTSNQKYDCVICNQCTPSKHSRLVGLVIFLQSSSVLGHRQRTQVEESILTPPTPEQVSQTRCGGIQRQRHTEMLKYFDEVSCDMSVNIGWDGGVYASTCGHYLHLDCHKSYIDTLKRNQSQTENISISRGEFYCPMCRQISNAMLPIIPEDDDTKATQAQPPTSDPATMARDIAHLIEQKHKQGVSAELVHAVNNTMEAVYNITYEPFHMLPHHSARNPFLFITSVARTNVELEILFRGGTLQHPLPPSTNKKLCLSPLLSVLSLHCVTTTVHPSLDPVETTLQQWLHITGVTLSTEPSTKLTQYKHRVPLLLRDMAAQLCQLVLLLPSSPLCLDHFLCIVRKVYCVTYIQALTVLSCRLTHAERHAWWQKGSEATASSLQRWLNFIIGQLKNSSLYKEMGTSDDFLAICQSVWSPLSVEAWTEEFCLPFLRVAALLRQALFGPCLEDMQTEQSEFVSLVRYLDLYSGDCNRAGEVTGVSCMKWTVTDPLALVSAWCHDLTFFTTAKTDKYKLLSSMDEKWVQPGLLSLPERYYDIFTTFRHQVCSSCRHVPKDPTLCLICGTFLCFREQCCADVTTSVFECVSHSVTCGGGTGIFLLVNSSIIVVLRGQRATLWGSVYLDQHGEEDRDLKRGKPLFLSRERLQLLESQWMNHNFEQSCKRWIWHRDHL